MQWASLRSQATLAFFGKYDERFLSATQTKEKTMSDLTLIEILFGFGFLISPAFFGALIFCFEIGYLHDDDCGCLDCWDD